MQRIEATKGRLYPSDAPTGISIDTGGIDAW